MFFSCPKILPMPVRPHPVRTFSSSEPEPQAKSNTLSSRFRLPVFGSWLSSVTMAGEDARNLLRRVELAGLLARAGGELADQVFVGVAQRVDVGREIRQPLGDLLMIVQSLALRSA